MTWNMVEHDCDELMIPITREKNVIVLLKRKKISKYFKAI